jgi:hypothetical protein
MFSSLQINPSFHDRSAVLCWEFSEPAANFIVQKAIGGPFGFKTLASVGDKSWYQDEAFVHKDNINHVYYKVVAQHRGQRTDSFPISVQTNPAKDIYGTAAAALRQESRSLMRNTRVLYYVQIRMGDQCEVCADTVTGQGIATSLCENCLGTGFVGGYEDSIKGWARQVQTSEGSQAKTPAGPESAIRSAWRTLPYPLLRRGDIIADADQKLLHQVESSQVFKVGGRIPLAQEAATVQLPRSNVAYILFNREITDG